MNDEELESLKKKAAELNALKKRLRICGIVFLVSWGLYTVYKVGFDYSKYALPRWMSGTQEVSLDQAFLPTDKAATPFPFPSQTVQATSTKIPSTATPELSCPLGCKTYTEQCPIFAVTCGSEDLPCRTKEKKIYYLPVDDGYKPILGLVAPALFFCTEEDAIAQGYVHGK